MISRAYLYVYLFIYMCQYAVLIYNLHLLHVVHQCMGVLYSVPWGLQLSVESGRLCTTGTKCNGVWNGAKFFIPQLESWCNLMPYSHRSFDGMMAAKNRKKNIKHFKSPVQIPWFSMASWHLAQAYGQSGGQIAARWPRCALARCATCGRGVHQWGYPQMDSLQLKIPLKLGWFGGTPISGNLHLFF